MNFDPNRVPMWRAGYRFQFEPAQERHVLLYPEGMIQLNDSAAAIGQLIDDKTSVSGIIDQLAAKFPDVPDIGEDIIQFMLVAEEQNWITLE